VRYLSKNTVMSENLMPVFEELLYMFGCQLPASNTVINEDDNIKQMVRQIAAMNLSQHVYVRLCIFQQLNTYLILFILRTASTMIHLDQHTRTTEIKSHL